MVPARFKFKVIIIFISFLFLITNANNTGIANTKEAGNNDGIKSSNNDVVVVPDYLIVGAGGAGIQMALFLEKYNATYNILEKTDHVGSHFRTFPRFDELISINKNHRDDKQRMRYDWHTMLEAPIRMWNITQEYFPQGTDWANYMEQVTNKAGIMSKIQFGVTVQRVSNDGKPCLYLSDGTEQCAKYRIFMGTGLQEKKQPILEAMGAIPYSKITTDMTKGRRVCILGNGNSGFEVAQNVYKTADRVMIFGRHDVRLSSITRYTGDVRIKYLQVLENLHMKLLDTVDSMPSSIPTSVKGLDDILTQEEIQHVNELHYIAIWLQGLDCETFVLTTGFESNVPNGLTIQDNNRFPSTTDWYKSIDNPSIHYIGWLMHERDFRISAGGFLSGFRYLIRNLAYRILYEDFNISSPAIIRNLSKNEIIEKAIHRIQTADDLFILQDGVTIRDVIVPNYHNNNNDNKNTISSYDYYEGITHDFYPDIMLRDDIISIYFEWGDGRTANTVFDGTIRYTDTKKFVNVLLHPVIQVNDKIRSIMEDVELEWTGSGFEVALYNTINNALDGKLDKFIPKQPFPAYEQTMLNQTQFDYYETPKNTNGTMFTNNLMQAIWKAVYTNGREQEIQDLKIATKEFLPKLFDIQQEGEVSGI